jgi:GNAT superfamily N-acetyltransferase
MESSGIRLASVGDAGAISALCGQIGYGASQAQIAERIAASAKQPDRQILVSERGNEVVGWIEVLVRDSLVSGRYAEIDGLVVDERRRGAGIGKALVARSCAWAAARGIARMRVRSNVTRDGALQFYRRLGFGESKRQAVFDKSIDCK